MLAYRRLKDDIVSMRLSPRQPLIEAELSESLAMSKTPIREALVRLARDGLVELSDFRGARVGDFTYRDVQEIYQLRALLEPEAIRLGFEKMDDDLFGKLRDTLEQARACAEEGDRVQLAALNRSFHTGLLSACGNERLLTILTQFSDQVRIISLRGWTQQPTYMIEADEHKGILDALELNRDVDEAATRLRDHIVGFLSRLHWNASP